MSDANETIKEAVFLLETLTHPCEDWEFVGDCGKCWACRSNERIEACVKELELARSENASLKQMLRKHQWSDWSDEEGPRCPECGCGDDSSKHYPDCALSKLLGDE